MVAERAFTAGLRRFFGEHPGVRVPIGDDAAVVRNRGPESVVACDPVVEGVHFVRESDLRLVGRKAVNRNLADLAAMGAKPDWLLVSLVLPPWLAGRGRRRLLAGIRSAARAGGCAVVGGDVASSRGPLVVTVTAIGHLPGAVLRRSGARAGDRIHVSGPIGGSAAGGHLTFTPPIAEGLWLARAGAASAAIDVSDGLLLDLATLLAASGPALGAELFRDAIPLRRGVRRDRRSVHRALGAGEDHVLLFTVKAGRTLPRGGPLRPLARRPIGRVVDRPGLFLVDAEGRRSRLAAQGWQHALAD
jgi:thiamine-monophosphate kinase